MLIHEDPHLNLFWVYGSRIKNQTDSDITNVNYLENNITKALVNTLENLPADSCRISFLKECSVLPQDALESSLEFEFRLQRKPDKNVVTSFPESNRFLWGISPTGDAWDIGKIPLEKMDFNNRKESIRFILEQIEDELESGNNEEDFAQKEAARLFDEIEAIQNNRGESIPDGWILIYKKYESAEREPLYCIAIENKWQKLDPYQLLNHWKKSLYHAEGKTSFSKFADIYKYISRYGDKSPVVSHFLEYLSLVGQEPFTYFRENDFSMLYVRDEGALTEYQKSILIKYRNLISNKFWNFFNGFIIDYVKRFNSEHLKQGLTVEYKGNNQRIYVKRNKDVEEIKEFNLYFDFDKTNGSFYISTEVGVDRAFINRRLLPFLKANNNMVLQLESHYENCIYSRNIRLNNINSLVYFWIKGFDTLENYLNEINTAKIAVSKRPKEDCINELQNLVAKTDYNLKRIEKVSRGKYKTWHWLEYLRIIEEFKIEEFCGEDAVNRLNSTLTDCINRHCEGIIMLKTLLTEAQK